MPPLLYLINIITSLRSCSINFYKYYRDLSLCAVAMFVLCIITNNAYAQGFEHVVKIRPHQIESFDFYETYTAIGQTVFQNSKSYYANHKGRIDYLSDKQGQLVQKGDIILIIDQEVSDNIKLAADAELHRAESSYKRDIKLYEKKVINEESLIESKAALATSKRQYAESMKIYNEMHITAPFDGILGAINAHLGEEVTVGDFLFTLFAGGKSEIIVNLPHTLHGKINKDSIAKLIDLTGEEVIGSIVSVSQYLSNSGTIPVKIHIPPYAKMLNGDFSAVQIIYNRHQALAVPEKAIMKNHQGSYIYKIVEGNLVKQIYVKLGVRLQDMIEIIDGDIDAGDMIVLDGIVKVQDGNKVEFIQDK